MKKSRTLTRNLFILACLAVLAAYAIGGIPNRVQVHASSTQIQNRTKAIEVVSVNEQEDSCSLTLRNNSAKAINGYSLGVGDRSKLDVDLTIGEKVIPPGSEFKESLPAPRSQTLTVISVLAVFFTDGSSEGDPEVVDSNRQRREGTKAQLKQILPLLRAALASPDALDLRALKQKIIKLPGAAERGVSSHFHKGMSRAKQDAVSTLEAVAPNTPNTRRQLISLVEDLEKRLSRL